MLALTGSILVAGIGAFELRGMCRRLSISAVGLVATPILISLASGIAFTKQPSFTDKSSGMANYEGMHPGYGLHAWHALILEATCGQLALKRPSKVGVTTPRYGLARKCVSAGRRQTRLVTLHVPKVEGICIIGIHAIHPTLY